MGKESRDVQTKVGRVVSVNGNTLNIQLLDSVKSNMPTFTICEKIIHSRFSDL